MTTWNPTGFSESRKGQITIQNNFVEYVDVTKVQYIASTMRGSSGAPVLNNSWEVVALHRASRRFQESNSDRYYFRNEGILISGILDDLPDKIRNQLINTVPCEDGMV